MRTVAMTALGGTSIDGMTSSYGTSGLGVPVLFSDDMPRYVSLLAPAPSPLGF